MNKYILSVFFTFVMFTIAAQGSSHRQDRIEDRPGLRFGMRLSPTITWISSDEVDLVDPSGASMGYSFGIVGDWFFKENYAISSGAFMSNMGCKLDYSDNMTLLTRNNGDVYNVGDVSLRANYLEVPIGFKFTTKEFWRFKFVGQCGFNQFFLLNAKATSDVASAIDDLGNLVTLDKKDVSDEFSSVHSAYHFGFGTEYALGGDAYLTGGVTAVIGLNDVTKSEVNVDGVTVDPVNKINSINFQIGFIF